MFSLTDAFTLGISRIGSREHARRPRRRSGPGATDASYTGQVGHSLRMRRGGEARECWLLSCPALPAVKSDHFSQRGPGQAASHRHRMRGEEDRTWYVRSPVRASVVQSCLYGLTPSPGHVLLSQHRQHRDYQSS